MKRAWIMVMFAGGALLACDKSGPSGFGGNQGAAPTTGSGTTPGATDKGSRAVASSMVDAAPAPEPAPAPAEPAVASGWKVFEDATVGYRVEAPKALEEQNMDDPAQHLELRRYSTMLDARSFGQVMYAKYTAAGAFDIEKGLDGACRNMVSAMGGTMVKYEKGTDKGRPTRDLTFTANLQGTPIAGFGRGVATGPKTILSVVSFYDASGDAAHAAQFIKSFEVK